MDKQAGLLISKVTPPALEPNLLRRSSLVKAFKRGLSRSVLLLHGSTGYGKTTALAMFLQDEQIPACWYRVTEGDQDWLSFCRYLVFALQTQFPSFGEDLLSYLSRCDPFDEEDQTLFLEKWVNQISRLSRKVVLILDDFHLIPSTSFVQVWMQQLIQMMPQNLHLLISSRYRLDWKGIAMMKVKGDLIELTQDDLRWTDEEIEVYLMDICQLNLSEEQVQQVCQLAQGWIVSLRFITDQFNNQRVKDLHFTYESIDWKDFFTYLKEESWEKTPYHLQQVLTKLSMCHPISISLYSEIFHEPFEEEWLKEMKERNIWIQTKDKSSFGFHPLFQRFIQSQTTLNSLEKLQIKRKLIDFYCQAGQIDQVATLLQELNDPSYSAQILCKMGKHWMEQGRLDELEKELRIIPDDIKDQYYRLWIYQGEIYRYRCQYEKGIQCYTRVERLARKQGDALGQSLGLEGQARVYLDTIQPGKAEYFLQRAIQVLDDLESYAEDRERLYGLMVENLVNIGRANDAGRWLEQHKELNSKYVDKELEVRLLLRTGRLRRAKQILEKKRLGEVEGGIHPLPRSHRETPLLLSLIYSLLGESEQAKQMAETGIMQGVEVQAPFVEACGWMRMGHAVQLIQRYERRLAEECYQTALAMMDEMRISRGKAEPLMGLALLYGKEGAFDLAYYYGKQALTETESVKDQWLSMMIRLSLGIAAYYDERWDRAIALFSECSDGFAHCGDSYFLTVSQLWQALTAFETENSAQFTSSLEQALKTMQTGGYECLLYRRTMFGPRDIQKWTQLLWVAQLRGMEDSYLTYLLTDLGLSKASSHPGYTLKIQTLGDFRVWLGDEEVLAKNWQREKAKELFQLLLTKRQFLLSKEEIYALLWPEADAKSAARDFKVALNALNNALEPKRSARATSFYIQRQGSLYGCNLSSGFELDSADFERWIQEGLKQDDLSLLQKGVDLYQGSYLPERRYDEWCNQERTRLQALFIRGTERLAQLLVMKGEFDAAITWCERILLEDSCWEEAYRLLMICYYQKNNRPQALRQFQKCRDALHRELGVEPMPKTMELMEKIRQGTLTCNFSVTTLN